MIASAYIDNYSPGAMVILAYLTSEISPPPRAKERQQLHLGDQLCVCSQKLSAPWPA